MSKKSDSDSSLSTTSRTLGKHGRLVNAGEMPPKGEAGKGTVILGRMVPPPEKARGKETGRGQADQALSLPGFGQAGQLAFDQVGPDWPKVLVGQEPDPGRRLRQGWFRTRERGERIGAVDRLHSDCMPGFGESSGATRMGRPVHGRYLRGCSALPEYSNTGPGLEIKGELPADAVTEHRPFRRKDKRTK